MSAKRVGKFNLKKLSENSNPNLRAWSPNFNKFDINQDGHDDLIIGIGLFNTDDRTPPNEFSKLVILFWDNDIKQYVVDPEVQKALPFMYYPRRIHGSVNPETGLTHLFIADTGLDLANYDYSKGMANLPPNCGAQNYLITFDPLSKKVSEIQLPKVSDYSHALATADMNGDKITDYVVLNSPYIIYPQKCLFNRADYTNGSYILYSNKNGGFDITNLELNYKGYSKAPTITSGTAVVDDKDSFLLLGSEDPGNGIYALKQDSKGSFTETSRFSAPRNMSINGQSGAYSEVLYNDIDGDGTKEVVASIATPKWAGRYIQLLDFNNGELTGRSGDVVQSNPTKNSNDWCLHLFFNEKTAWNEPILTCTNGSQSFKSRGYFYTWTENKLQLAKIKSKKKEAFRFIREIHPVTIDQKNVFLGSELSGNRKVNGHRFYEDKEFYLIEPAVAPNEASNAFDGSYWFRFNMVFPDGRILADGYAPLLINEGIVTVKKGSMGGYNDSGQMSVTFFDSFKGTIDKNGDVVASFHFSICGHCDIEEQTIEFRGNIKSQKLSGMFDDVKVILDMN